MSPASTKRRASRHVLMMAKNSNSAISWQDQTRSIAANLEGRNHVIPSCEFGLEVISKSLQILLLLAHPGQGRLELVDTLQKRGFRFSASDRSGQRAGVSLDHGCQFRRLDLTAQLDVGGSQLAMRL